METINLGIGDDLPPDYVTRVREGAFRADLSVLPEGIAVRTGWLFLLRHGSS